MVHFMDVHLVSENCNSIQVNKVQISSIEMLFYNAFCMSLGSFWQKNERFLNLWFKVEALWFKCFIIFLENLVLVTFICADNESKIKKIGRRLRFWDTGVAKTTYFLSKSHDLPHKVIREVRQININVLQKATNASFIFLIFTYIKVYLKYYKITK